MVKRLKTMTHEDVQLRKRKHKWAGELFWNYVQSDERGCVQYLTCMSPGGRTGPKSGNQLSKVKRGCPKVWVHHHLRLPLGAECHFTEIMWKRLAEFSHFSSPLQTRHPVQWSVFSIVPSCWRCWIQWCSCHILFFKHTPTLWLSFSKHWNRLQSAVLPILRTRFSSFCPYKHPVPNLFPAVSNLRKKKLLRSLTWGMHILL